MDVGLFDFELPDDLIALRPASPRDSARMLVVHPGGAREHARITDLPRFLAPGDTVVVNDTKVIAARLRGRRLGGGDAQPAVEVLLHKRLGDRRFLAFARPGKKLHAGDRLALGETLHAVILRKAEGGEVELAFEPSAADIDAEIARHGEVPLPPYIAKRRKTDLRDVADYQTIFGRRDGSVAAPTAGLHFTDELLLALAARGIGRQSVTLHVGAGTFQPVAAADTQDHRMHSEFATVEDATADALNRTRRSGGRIAAVGTTTLRTLETATTEDGVIRPYEGETDIFITPGYRFRAVDVLLTNFHVPRSTLFMLVCAFSGLETMKAAYREAIEARYRFYSYGDACLLLRAPQ